MMASVPNFRDVGGRVLPRYAPVIETFAGAGGERAILEAIFGVKARHLDAAFEEMETRYGSVEGYFADGLGVDPARQETLRSLHLETPRP